MMKLNANTSEIQSMVRLLVPMALFVQSFKSHIPKERGFKWSTALSSFSIFRCFESRNGERLRILYSVGQSPRRGEHSSIELFQVTRKLYIHFTVWLIVFSWDIRVINSVWSPCEITLYLRHPVYADSSVHARDLTHPHKYIVYYYIYICIYVFSKLPSNWTCLTL